jgi:hypothetical protein
MASRRKVLWHVPNVGQLRCLKKDPNKLAFYIEAWHTKRDRLGKKRGPYFFYVRDPRVPTWFLVRKVKQIAEDYSGWGPAWKEIYGERTERALDYLFAELSRRAPEPVVG